MGTLLYYTRYIYRSCIYLLYTLLTQGHKTFLHKKLLLLLFTITSLIYFPVPIIPIQQFTYNYILQLRTPLQATQYLQQINLKEYHSPTLLSP